jgi:hypothetical protein
LALGNVTKKVDLYVVDSTQSGCNSLRPPDVVVATSPVPVSVVPLDSWLREQKLSRIDFIKMDVEGGELEVFKGATELLERRPRPVVLVEVQDIRTLAWGYKARDTIDCLRQKGYDWFSLGQNGSIVELDTTAQEFDGNFVAWPKESKISTDLKHP